jgi:RNA polymerase sigma-70 factor (ECF subfamily)
MTAVSVWLRGETHAFRAQEQRVARALGSLDAGPVTTGDDALVIAARTQPEAFGQLYQRHVAPVYRYVRTRCTSDEEAADVTQAVFVKAMASLDRFRLGSPFAAWLFRIARNASTDAYRRRRKTVGLETLPESLLQSLSDSPEEVAIKQERLRRLRGLVARLEGDKQEMLALRFGAGLTMREIAAVTGKHESAIKKQMSRIMAALKEQYFEQPE